MIQINTTINYQVTSDLGKYLKAIIPFSAIQSYLPFLKKYLGDDKSEKYILNQQKRDNYTYHMTIVKYFELDKLTSSLDAFVNYPLLIEIFGIGHIKENDNEACFLVCNCPLANRLRNSLGLEKIDMHITVAFKTSDIHDKPKDINTLIEPFKTLEVAK